VGRFVFIAQIVATVLCTKGKEIIASRVADLLNVPRYLAVGVGPGTSDPGDTTLFGEVSPRVICDLSLVRIDTGNDRVRAVATWTNFGAIITLTNTGIFDADSSGNLLCKADGVGQALDTNEGLEITWDIKITGQC